MFGTLVAYPVGENERIQMVKNKQKAQLQSLEKTKKRLAGFVSAFRARNALLGQVLERWGCQDQRGSGPATCLVGGQAGQHGICPTTPPLGISGMHAHIPGCPRPHWAHSARGLSVSSLVWVQAYSFQGPFQGGICEESSKLHHKYLIFVALGCFFFKMDSCLIHLVHRALATVREDCVFECFWKIVIHDTNISILTILTN